MTINIAGTMTHRWRVIGIMKGDNDPQTFTLARIDAPGCGECMTVVPIA